MANNSNCGCMGALNSIARSMNHCGTHCTNPEYYQDFPYYNGPCPPCACSSGCSGQRCRRHCGCGNNSCGSCGNGNGCSACSGCGNCGNCSSCNNGCNGCNSGSCGCNHTRCSAGMFTANAPLSVAAGEAVPLMARRHNPDCFEICGGCIRIRKPGLYHVVWTMNMPSYQNFSGCLYLTLNGNEVDGSGQTVCCQADNTSTSATGQAMVQTGPNGLLCLNTDCGIEIGNGCSVENVLTMTVTRVN